MRRGFRLAAIGAALLMASQQGLPALAGVAYCPTRSVLKLYEPAAWDYGDGSGDKVIDAITSDGGKDQGYTYLRYQDTAKGSSVGTCTRADWDNLSNLAGVTYVDSHGGSYFVHAAYSTDKSVLFDETSGGGWADKDGDKVLDPNMVVVGSEQDGWWGVVVLEDWYSDHWKADHNTHKAIVLISTCQSNAAPAPTILENCGGRTGFGYSACAPTSAGDMENLFGRMDGTLPPGAQGTKRKAGDAFAAGSFSTYFTMRGEEDTTLCPAPAEWGPKGTGAGASGMGYIEFDTHCTTTHAATSALTCTIDSGDITISNIQWASDYRLTFNYTATTCNEDYKVTVTAVAAHVLGSTGGSQKLDGSKVAPNGDNKTWSFED